MPRGLHSRASDVPTGFSAVFDARYTCCVPQSFRLIELIRLDIAVASLRLPISIFGNKADARTSGPKVFTAKTSRKSVRPMVSTGLFEIAQDAGIDDQHVNRLAGKIPRQRMNRPLVGDIEHADINPIAHTVQDI